MRRMLRLMFVSAAFAVLFGMLLANLARAEGTVATDAVVKEVALITAKLCLQADAPDCCDRNSGFMQSYSQPVCVGRLLRMRCEDGTYSDRAGWCKDVGLTYRPKGQRMWERKE